jgi:hypothetical protein
MIPIYRYFEVALFSVLNFMPFLCLAIYAFRRRLRFSNITTNVWMILMCLLQIGIGFVAAFSTFGSDVLSVVSTVAYAGFLFLLVKDSPGKVIFVLLSLSKVVKRTQLYYHIRKPSYRKQPLEFLLRRDK